VKTLFADTGYWIALLVGTDDLHDKAVSRMQELGPSRILTSEYVLIEVLNDLSGRGRTMRNAAVDLAHLCMSRETDRFVRASDGLFSDSIDLYSKRPDKNWSFTDCASMVICDRQEIKEVLTHDRHFEQAGLIALLR
jgi:uncharacterized protein